jgi:hypothetical protein
MIGKKNWKDRKSEVMMNPQKSTPEISHRRELKRQKEKHPQHVHQSLASATSGRCGWMRCPGIARSKAKENAPTTRSCNVRSAQQMQDAIFICARTQRLM